MSEKELLQKPVLDALQNQDAVVAVFLANGIKLVGKIVHQDPFTLCLRDARGTQIVYKHAISTVSAVTGAEPPSNSEPRESGAGRSTRGPGDHRRR